MMPLYLSAFLCHIMASSSMSLAEKQFVCSSEIASVWYSYNGPLYYLSVSLSPCSLGMSVYNITCTVIPMFTIKRMGFHALIYYKDQLWLDYVQPDVPCEDLKICSIVKGETLHDTVPIYVRKYYGPKGKYQVFVEVNIIDDTERMLTLHFNITMQIKSANHKNIFFQQLGGL